MRVLLDTHTLLWYAEANPQLSEKACQIILDPQNEIVVSMASFWEMAIKIGLDKLTVKFGLSTLYQVVKQAENTQILHIEFRHIEQLKTLPLHHRDPFDRILIAQSLTDNLPILTVDEHFAQYPIAIIW